MIPVLGGCRILSTVPQSFIWKLPWLTGDINLLLSEKWHQTLNQWIVYAEDASKTKGQSQRSGRWVWPKVQFCVPSALWEEGLWQNCHPERYRAAGGSGMSGSQVGQHIGNWCAQVGHSLEDAQWDTDRIERSAGTKYEHEAIVDSGCA